jgi:NAD(P)-dependent dehydrogenase (short-subunit alcohol dehydrogenase family)
MEAAGQKARAGSDLSTPEGADDLAKRLSGLERLAGMILVMEGAGALDSMEAASPLLTGIFRLLKAFVVSPSKAFCLLMHRDLLPHTPAAVAAEGVLGMFLAAAQEYASVLFRSAALDQRSPLKEAMEKTLDADTRLIQMRFRKGEAFTSKARAKPLAFADAPSLGIHAGDVVVVSGGARGISAHLARALALFRPRLILLGRSRLEDQVKYGALLAAGTPDEARIRRIVKKESAGLADHELAAEVTRVRTGLEIARTVRELAQWGAEVTYEQCDVCNAGGVKQVLDGIVRRYGRIDGVVHGAGVIQDAFMAFMTPEAFARVVEVKLSGAWNLFRAARDHGLRFAVVLSSMAAALGNAGQVNYCAANRAMSALAEALGEGPGAPVCKALMLPPVEGTGMADDPEVKELMKLRGMDQAYLHVHEVAELFCRELFMAPKEQRWVMFARSLPAVKTVGVDSDGGDEAGLLPMASTGMGFKAADLPMIESISHLDLKAGHVEASRTFSPEKDLWLEDHRPFKFLGSPLVSGVMAVEAFLEAARALHPYLSPLGLRGVRYREILECQAGQVRYARISCRRLSQEADQVVCQADLSSRDTSPSGRELDRWCINYEGQVMMGRPSQEEIRWPHPRVRQEDLDTRPMPNQEVLEWYERRTGLQGRYRVMEGLDGTGPGIIRGTMIYGERGDFAMMRDAQYQYSPYLLEALMHLANFYLVMRDEGETRSMIPAEMGEVRFSRRCAPGEPLALEARLRGEDADGHSWDARALDGTGATIMQVLDLRLRWFRE